MRFGFIYEVQFDRILQNLRKPWILYYCKTEMNQICEYVIEALLENGRLRFSQILNNVLTKLNYDATDEEVKTTFIRLVNHHYIERSPPCSLPKPPSFYDASMSQKRLKTTKDAANDATVAAQREYGEYEKDRFRLPLSLVFDEEVPLGEKRKNPELRKTSILVDFEPSISSRC